MPASKPLDRESFAAIADAADELRRNQALVAEQRRHLDQLLIDAIGAGGQVEAVANAAGLSRQAVYNAADRALDDRRQARRRRPRVD